MAIKGKKKAQGRGGHARRRPAGAPRPAAVASRRIPWYRTDGGRVAAAIGIAAVVGIVWWAVARAQGDSAELDRRQEGLETYAGEVQALVQSVRPAAQGLASLSGGLGARARGTLADQTKGWLSSLEAARKDLGGFSPPAALITAQGLLSQSLALYESSARTVRAAGRADGAVASEVLAGAVDARDAANSVWLSAVQLIDSERRSADLGPSGVGFPGAPAPGGQQPAAPGGSG